MFPPERPMPCFVHVLLLVLVEVVATIVLIATLIVDVVATIVFIAILILVVLVCLQPCSRSCCQAPQLACC